MLVVVGVLLSIALVVPLALVAVVIFYLCDSGASKQPPVKGGDKAKPAPAGKAAAKPSTEATTVGVRRRKAGTD